MPLEIPTTIYSDDEIDPEPDFDSEEDKGKIPDKAPLKISKKSEAKAKKTATANSNAKKQFSFEFDDGETIITLQRNLDKQSKSNKADENQYDETTGSDSSSDSDESLEDYGEGDDNVRLMPRTEERTQRAVEKQQKIKNKKIDKDLGEGMDDATEKTFFDEVIDSNAGGANADAKRREAHTFAQLNLSRPLLRAIEASGYVSPTPIQAQVIPIAMAGRDVCASAVTGSGKTAAFVLPVLERLLYRPRDTAAIRMLVVTPTRELATQIFAVLQKLAQFTDVTCALICGGKKDLKSQEATLRNRPDIVVCTPGRIIDHLRNSHSVSISDLDVLVLDEVDRLLELGFQEEVEELIRFCPENRQTLLFSATMTPRVEDLAKLSLKKPIRVKTSAGVTTLAPRLVQEFVKVRKDDEHQREAMMAALVCRSFSHRTIAFFETKKEAHRFYVVLTLLGASCCELHGDMTQSHRYLALEKFRTGQVEIMVCTDVAARGLDIPGVQTVLNAEMPRSASTYVHRVGRTARAGCGGRSVTLVSDARRKVMKDVLKQRGEVAGSSSSSGTGSGSSTEIDLMTLSLASSQQVLSRTIPPAVVSHFSTKIASLEGSIDAFYREEKASRSLELAEQEAERAENLLLYQDEINARPARTWYQTEAQKKDIRESTRQVIKIQDEALKTKGAPKRSASEIAAELALKDDYQLDEKDKAKSKDHRMDRRKRRRLEALKAINEEAEGGADDDEGHDNKKEVSVKHIAKNAKTVKREAAEKLKETVLGDIGAKKAKVKNEAGKTKILRPKFAVGGLDQELMQWGIGGGGLKSKDRKKMDRQIETFRGYDPDKSLRKGGKVGHKAFKSKARYKRRS